MKRKYLAAAVCAAVLISIPFVCKRATVEAAAVQAPRFEVDPILAEATAQSLGDRRRDRRRGGWKR